jgi:hypothetical protein
MTEEERKPTSTGLGQLTPSEEELPKASEIARNIFETNLTQDLVIIQQMEDLKEHLVNEKLIKLEYNNKELEKQKIEFKQINKEFDETYINKDDPIALKQAGLIKVEDLKIKIKLLLEDNYFRYEDDNDNTKEGYYSDLEEELLKLLGDKE